MVLSTPLGWWYLRAASVGTRLSVPLVPLGPELPRSEPGELAFPHAFGGVCRPFPEQESGSGREGLGQGLVPGRTPSETPLPGIPR